MIACDKKVSIGVGSTIYFFDLNWEKEFLEIVITRELSNVSKYGFQYYIPLVIPFQMMLGDDVGVHVA